MWFGNWSDIWRIVVMAVVIYVALVAILRFAGKRSLAKLNIFDFVVTVALGSTLATIILTKAITFAEGVAAFAILAALQYFVGWLSLRAQWFRALTRSEARLLFRDGEFLEEAMRAERVTRGDIEAAIRQQGHGRMSDIAAVVLETDGSFSVIAGGPADTLSALKPLLQSSDSRQ